MIISTLLSNYTLKKNVFKTNTGSLFYQPFFNQIQSLYFSKTLSDELLWQWPLCNTYLLDVNSDKKNIKINYL